MPKSSGTGFVSISSVYLLSVSFDKAPYNFVCLLPLRFERSNHNVVKISLIL
jgi:hypothetical protein